MKVTQLNDNDCFKTKITPLQWIVATLFLFNTSVIQAAELEKDFYVTTEVSHLSNPSYEKSNKRPVTVFRVQPEFNLAIASELNKVYLKSLLAIYRNSNEDVLPDRENPSVVVGWERTLASGLFGLEASYNEDVSLTEQLARVGSATGNTVNNQTKTKRIAAKWNHDFNANVSLQNEASYSDVSYSKNSPFLEDYTVASLSSKGIYRNTELLSSYAQLGFLQLDPDVSTKSNLSRLRLGVISTPFDGAEVDAGAGLYKTTGPSSNSGMEAELLAKYVRDRMSYNLALGKTLTPGGISEFQKTQTFSLGVKYLLSDVQSLGAAYENRRNKLDSNSQSGLLAVSNSVRTQSFGVFYEHSFKDWIARANAKLTELDNGTTRYGNEIGVTLTYGPWRF